MFLILSGYGLYKTYKSSAVEFYKKSFKKLYSTYWLIWLLFVPPGVFYFHRTFDIVYGTNIIGKFLANLFGVHLFFGFWGYNPTWWFMSLIIALYILFPLFYKLFKNNYNAVFLTVISFLISITPQLTSLPKFGFVFCFAASFVFGMLLAKFNIIEKLKEKINKVSGKDKIFLIFPFCIIILYLCYLRIYYVGAGEAGSFTIVDVFLAWLVIQFVFSITRNYKNIFVKFLELLGENSFSIFLFHTFIYGIYFYSYVYSLKYAILIFPAFTICCLVIALIISKIQTIINLIPLKMQQIFNK